jgi:CRP/FNR family transcriptional regulator, cyclic AMP receptor protein
MRTRLLDVLDEGERSAVLEATRRRVFQRNEVVFHDGDSGDTLHLVVKGHFAVRVTTPLGDIATLRVLGPGEHFGELAVLDAGPRNGSVVALEQGVTLILRRDVVAELRARYPMIDAVLTAALVAEVRRLADALVDALYVPAERRVWRRLRELVDLYGTDAAPVVIPVTQDDLAQLAGTTRPTANRALRAGCEKGIVMLARGRIEVHDVAGLQRLGR